jgi:ribosome biogenesis GTPase
MDKKRKVRVDLRKNRSKPPRERGWTREYQRHGFEESEDTPRGERVRAKGELSRRRTIIAETEKQASGAARAADMPAVDEGCIPGRVVRVQGLWSQVVADDGRQFRCAVRRLLRNLVIDERNILTTGDRVWFRPATSPPNPPLRSGEGGKGGEVNEGVIERIEPRHGVLTRASRGKEQVLVANVDQMVIVTSLAEPALKPHLIDRYLVSAEQGRIASIVCLNKADLVDAADYQMLLGLYSQLGIPVFLTSAKDGRGIDALRERLRGRQTVFSGQSGVGKSSLLNAIQPGLDLAVREVSDATQKGKHTTTTAELIRLNLGPLSVVRSPLSVVSETTDNGLRTTDNQAWVVDTPGIRQFALWDINADDLEGFFPEFRPYVPHCPYPDCTHTHEEACAIKTAVKRHHIVMQRYESYLGLRAGTSFE